MQLTSILKRTAMAAVTAAALTGVVTPANALQFVDNDAVLVIYGNTNEAYINLGNWTTLKQNGTSLDLSSVLAQAGITGANPVEYTVFGNAGAQYPMFWGSADPLSSYTTTQRQNIVAGTLNSQIDSWAGQLNLAADAARVFYTPSDPLSFTTYFNGSNNDRLANALTRRASNDIGNILYMLEKTAGGSALSAHAQVTTAFLASNGAFTLTGVNPVPVPAAAVLFASGLIGLVGMARRSLGLTR